MSLLLAICRDLSWLSPSTGTRVALLLLDLYTMPNRFHYAIGEVIAALQEHDPEYRHKRQRAARMMRDLLADLRKSETQRKREAN